MKYIYYLLIFFVLMCSCKVKNENKNCIDNIAILAADWEGKVIAMSDESYIGWDVEIGDADNDGKNELVVSTRGDNQSENIDSDHLGHVFMYSVQPDGTVGTELIVDLNEEYAESSWIDVGDADNDGKNEIVLATGKGDRTKPGKSYIIIVENTSSL